MKKQTTKPQDLNTLAKEIHANSEKHGFWQAVQTPDHFLMLAVSELSEAVEADRHRRYLRPDYKVIVEKDCENFESRFKELVKDTVDDELADAVIRLLDLAGANGVNLENIKRVKCSAISSEDSFSGNVFQTVKILTDEKLTLAERIASGILSIEVLCHAYKIDLWWNVYEKMRFNATRPYLHGKKY